MSISDDHRYDDIIRLPHHVSATRPHMSMHDRAAQFSPFAALTGHAAAIAETARRTQPWVEPDDNIKEILDNRLQEIAYHPSRPVTFTYFVPDESKDGGSYVDCTGTVKTIDSYTRTVVMTDLTNIPIDRITWIE